MTKRILYIVLLFSSVTACDLLKKEASEDAVARVGDTYLYKADIPKLTDGNMSKLDSTMVVKNYIKNWATQQLFIRQAQLNLNKDKQEGFDVLVKNYKNDLYTRAYKDAIVKQQLDTVVSAEEAQRYYDEYQYNFKLNDKLLKLRYIQIAKNHQDFNQIKDRFVRFNSEDKVVLDSIAIQFSSYSLNDSIWVKANQVFKKIPSLQLQAKEELLKKSNFLQLEDSLRVYLVQIKDALPRNKIAPLAYIEPTVKQIIINKRKLTLVKQLEIDITDDAIKDKEFEVYE